MNNSIYPCVWFESKATDAADFYVRSLPETLITSSNQVVTMLSIMNQPFMLINGGPNFVPNPSISFMLMHSDEQVIERMWERLLEGGKILMALDSYPWSPRYGWVEDKYGVSWQLYLATEDQITQSLTPTLLYCQSEMGRAEEAIKTYTTLFPNSSIEGILKYGAEQPTLKGLVQHAQFDIDGFTLMAMDGDEGHRFSFSDGVSLVVMCADQVEVDKYWIGLTSDGGSEGRCGWLKDRYGVSWQIVPNRLLELMQDKTKAAKVNNALMKMNKIIILELEEAGHS